MKGNWQNAPFAFPATVYVRHGVLGIGAGVTVLVSSHDVPVEDKIFLSLLFTSIKVCIRAGLITDTN